MVLLTPRASKQLATLLFVSSVLGCTALIAQYSGGALGYEASLLAVVFPWVPLILTGSFIAVCAWAVLAATYRHTSSVPFLAGTLSLTAIYYVILALPGIRYGAPYDRWDVWFYLGFGTDTQTTGHVNFLADFYPGLQTLTVGLYNIAAVPQEVTIAFLFPLIAALRIPVLALAGRRLLGNSGGLLTACVASITGFSTTGLYGSPWGFSLLLLDFFVLAGVVTAGSRRREVRALLLLIGVAVVLSHILTAFAILLAAMLAWLWALWSRRGDRTLWLGRSSLPIIASFGVITLGYLFLVTNVYRVPIQVVLSNLGRSNPILFEAASSKNFGLAAIFQVLFPEVATASFALVGLLFLLRSKNRLFEGLLVPFLFLSGIVLFVLEETTVRRSLFGPNRPLSILAQATPLLGGAMFSRLLACRRQDISVQSRWVNWFNGLRRPFTVAFGALMILAFAYGTLTVYPSPAIFNINPQFTACEKTAVIWLGTSNPGLSVRTDESLSRSSFYFSRTVKGWVSGYWGYDNSLPAHLNVSDFTEPTVALISDHVLAKGFSGLVPNWTISQGDWASFSSSPNVSMIYDCGDAHVFLLRPPT